MFIFSVINMNCFQEHDDDVSHEVFRLLKWGMSGGGRKQVFVCATPHTFLNDYPFAEVLL